MRVLLAVGAVVLLVALSVWSQWFAGDVAAPAPGPATTAPSAPRMPAGTRAGEAAQPTEPQRHSRRAAPESPSTTAPTLHGRLTQGGAPLAGVTLQLCRHHHWRAVEIARTTTADDGVFSFPTPNERCWLTCDAPAAPRNWHSHWLRASDSGVDVGDISVPQPAVVEGQIRDADGLAIAGARVWIEADNQVRVGYVPGDKVEWFDVPADTNGRFRIERVRPGDARVVVQAAAFARSRTAFTVEAGATANVDVEVDKGLTLEGIVLDWRGKALPGAVVACETNELEAVADGIGRFVMPCVPRHSYLEVNAAGHIQQSFRNVFRADELARVQLLRAVTLSGVVHGTNGKPGVVRIEPSRDRRPGVPPEPYSLLMEDLDVLRDGRFEVVGLSTSDFEVSVRVPGVGRAGPVRVEMRDDTEVELTLTPQHTVLVHVRDAHGKPIADAGILINNKVARYPSSYRHDDPDLLEKLLDRGYAAVGKPPLPADDGTATVGHAPVDPLGFVVRATGYLDQGRLFAAGEVPDEVEVVLDQAGGVRGIVHGDAPTGCFRSVQLWPAEHAQPPKKGTLSMPVDASGAFSAKNVAPGSYRAALYRLGNGHASKDSQAGNTPLIDDGVDLREIVAVRVLAGETTEFELQGRSLGVLRGRVLMRGAPLAGATVVAARPKPAEKTSDDRLVSWHGANDWDDQLLLGWASGQFTDEHGAFRMLYRDAGPVELRVRHPQAHATSAPLLVQLPPPGDDVVRDLVPPIGEIRGRFAIEELAEKERGRLQITLFPLRRAGRDAFSSFGDRSLPVASNCASVEGSTDGSFAFRFLPRGTWVVRAHESWGTRNYWQQVVQVNGDRIELGDVNKTEGVGATLRWRWLDNGLPAGKVTAAWLWQEHAGEPRAIWVATLPAKNGVIACPGIAPGRYTVVPLEAYDYGGMLVGRSGINGQAVAEATSVEVRADGSTQPATLLFAPLPAK